MKGEERGEENMKGMRHGGEVQSPTVKRWHLILTSQFLWGFIVALL